MDDFECNEFVVGKLNLSDKEKRSIAFVDDLRRN
jgi:hypothetical protein